MMSMLWDVDPSHLKGLLKLTVKEQRGCIAAQGSTPEAQVLTASYTFWRTSPKMYKALGPKDRQVAEALNLCHGSREAPSVGRRALL